MTFRPPFARAREISRGVVRDPQPEASVARALPTAPKAVAAPPPVVVVVPAPVMEAPIPAAIPEPEPEPVAKVVEVAAPVVLEATPVAESNAVEPLWSSKMKKSELLEIAIKNGLDVAEETSKNELMRKLERAGL